MNRVAYNGLTYVGELPADPNAEPTLRQVREAVIRRGLFDKVENVLNLIPDPVERQIARNAWEYSNSVNPLNDTAKFLATVLNYGPQEQDEFIAYAKTL